MLRQFNTCITARVIFNHYTGSLPVALPESADSDGTDDGNADADEPIQQMDESFVEDEASELTSGSTSNKNNIGQLRKVVVKLFITIELKYC